MFWPLLQSLLRRKALLLLLGLLAGAWMWHAWREPRYLGRPVSSWIQQAPYDNSSGSEADQALRYFGERAVPYLIDAMERPQKWEHGPLSRIPRRFLNAVLDLPQQNQVRGVAIWRLQELVRQEAERADLEVNPSYPLADRLMPIWRRELRQDPSGAILYQVENLGVRMTNLAAEVRPRFQGISPAQHEWVQSALLLSETHDPALIPLFLPFTRPPQTDQTIRWAWVALGRNAVPSDQLASALRTALATTNRQIRVAALHACARLDLCAAEAVAVIEQVRAAGQPLDAASIEGFSVAEAILRWEMAGAGVGSVALVEKNLSKEVKPYTRLSTVDMLQSLGPKASPFIPALKRMALEDQSYLRAPVVRALRRIDLAEAQQFVATLPPRPLPAP